MGQSPKGGQMASNDLKTDVSGLTTKQRRVLQSLLSGGDRDAAAAAGGVSRRTVDRYLASPDFRVVLDKATGAAIGDVSRRMIGGMETAVSIMLELAENENTPASVRLRAAIAIVETGSKLFEQHELIKRLERLENLRDYQD